MSRIRLILLIWLLPCWSLAANLAHIDGITAIPGLNQSTFQLILSNKTSGHVKYRPAENKLYIQFNHIDPQLSIKNMQMENANVSQVLATATQDGKVEFAFTLTKRIKWAVRFLSGTDKTHQQFELVLSSLDVAHDKAPPQKASRPLAKLNKHDTELKKDLIIVAIDPGHGGKDPGTVGPKGTKEKDVVLKIAQQLANRVNLAKGMRAVLTRTGDYFITLRDRLQVARKNDADILIAIHADGFFDKRAKGASVYALSERGATSEAGRWLAQRETYAEVGNVDFDKLHDDSSDLRSVLIDLAQTATIQNSLRLGSDVLSTLDSVSTLHAKKVAQAPFVVLRSPDIPSILVETGFLTNPSEEGRLKKWSYQTKIADALYEAVSKYKKNTVA